MLRRSLILAVLLLPAPAAAASAWLDVTSDAGPGPREGPAAAFDDDNKEMLLFGGRSAAESFSDTWSWDGEAWRQRAAAGPSPRAFSALAYDAERNQSVLFGGTLPGTGLRQHSDETWLWDGSSWAAVGGTAPPARSAPGIAYDAKAERVIMFGGLGATGPLADTWLWDGVAWSNVSLPGPAARFECAMTYDDARDEVLLYGGRDNNGAYADTWRWAGDAWQLLADDGAPGLRSGHSMAFDASRDRVVMMFGSRLETHTGGLDVTNFLNDAWEWNGERWQETTPDERPDDRRFAAVAYDSERHRVISYGGAMGTLLYRDTWEYLGQRSHLSCRAVPGSAIAGLAVVLLALRRRRR